MSPRLAQFETRRNARKRVLKTETVDQSVIGKITIPPLSVFVS